MIPLQLPQGLAVGIPRSPYVATYRVALLLSRAISGVVLGFANMNFQATLLDLFGSSLQSNKPHEEFVLDDDPRRHGGGMGVWLGIWSWCFFGSLGVGFLIGAAVISGLNPAWGFWLVILLAALVLLFNILVPEVRRSPFRKSMTEVRSGTDVSRRLARGEVMMHLYATGPLWWGEEVRAGLVLCWRMMRQPGFAVLSVYVSWLYAQMVMIVMVREPCCVALFSCLPIRNRMRTVSFFRADKFCSCWVRCCQSITVSGPNMLGSVSPLFLLGRCWLCHSKRHRYSAAPGRRRLAQTA